MKPILFNTEMVRAILEGRKTVTRRVVKPQSKNACGFYVTTRKSDGAFMGVYDYDENERMFENSQTPPAHIGQVLYVRETFFQAVSHYLDVTGECVSVLHSIFEYLADGKHKKGHWYNERQDYYMVKRPSIHMPKEAARIFLRVTDVRVERLQDISREDIKKEGLIDFCDKCKALFSECDTCMNEDGLEEDFKSLWDSTIKKDQLNTYGWEANPYVWVIEFEVIDKAAALRSEAQ